MHKPLRVSNVVTPITKLTIGTVGECIAIYTIAAILAVSRFIKIVTVCAVNYFIAITNADASTEHYNFLSNNTYCNCCSW